jgi:hypothetical protein
VERQGQNQAESGRRAEFPKHGPIVRKKGP